MENLIKALQIFLKYGNPKWPTHCEHDVMYVNINYNLVTIDDKILLRDLGFVHNIEDNTFKSYVFGSA